MSEAIGSFGLSEERAKAVLNALSPTVTIPDGASKGEPNGTWSFSCSVMGLGMGISANFKDDGTLTMSAQAPVKASRRLMAHGARPVTRHSTFPSMIPIRP